MICKRMNDYTTLGQAKRYRTKSDNGKYSIGEMINGRHT